MRNAFSLLLFLLTLGVVGGLVQSRLPCARPVAISVGRIDAQFDLTSAELLTLVKEAKAAWEKAGDRPLFEIVPEGGIPVNVIYDARQQATIQLQELDQSIKATEGRRQVVQAEYERTRTDYDARQASFDRDLADYQRRRQAYLDDTTSQASPSPLEYSAFERRRQALNAENTSFNQRREELNSLAQRINTLVAEDRALVPAENTTIDAFNDLAKSQGEEFQTGLFTSGPGGATIDLYVYEDRAQLLRLLMHEMGHAVGFGHVADDQALMHRLNISKQPVITPADTAELVATCRQSDPSAWPELILARWRALIHDTSLNPA